MDDRIMIRTLGEGKRAKSDTNPTFLQQRYDDGIDMTTESTGTVNDE